MESVGNEVYKMYLKLKNRIIEAVRFRCCQIPVEEIVSVDEQMIPFKGHLNVKQS